MRIGTGFAGVGFGMAFASAVAVSPCGD